MACTANHDSGLPQLRHWCETNFRCLSPPFTRIGRVEKFGGAGGGDPRRVGLGAGGGKMLSPPISTCLMRLWSWGIKTMGDLRPKICTKIRISEVHDASNHR